MDLKLQLKHIIIDTLMIEDMQPDEIGDELTLFGEGLALDSVDALELAVELERVFGVSFPDAEKSRAIFMNVDSLAAHIEANR